MAKQDDFVRITVRLPPRLHTQLSAAASGNSLNAEIVGRLEESLDKDMQLQKIVTELRASRKRLEAQATQLMAIAERAVLEREVAVQKIQALTKRRLGPEDTQGSGTTDPHTAPPPDGRK